MIPCTYTKTFPVDEWDRPGGFFSLADVPIAGHKELTREGTVLARDTSTQLYEVEDYENGWVFIVPMDDVVLNEEEDTQDV